MKKLLPMALGFITAAVLTVGSPSVFAEDTSATAPSTATSNSTDSTINAKEFQERKARILQHISDRLTKMQQIQSCVQAANNFKALKDCKPHKSKEHGDKDSGQH